MGKGDKKTKRGKIVNGSYGRLRRRKKTTNKYVKPVVADVPKEEVVEVKEEKPVVKKKAAKKPAAKKTATKKTTAKKETKEVKAETKKTKKPAAKKTTAKKTAAKADKEPKEEK